MTLRAGIGIAVVTLLLHTAYAAPAPEPASVSATQLTVRLFSVREVQKVTITPVGNDDSMRMCAQCPRQPVTAPVKIEATPGGIRLASSVNEKQILLSGAFRIKANGSDQEVNAAGEWTVTQAQGSLRMLLTLPSERYVAAALSGEASPDEPMESLKAMAVAMRTFALINANRHIQEGFGLCDSTHCQALKFGKIRPEILRAVKETAGETLWFGQQRAHIYYTQHCGGITEAASNVWPNEKTPYLTSHPDPYCLRHSSALWSTQIHLDQLGTIFKREGWHTPATLEDIRIASRTPSGHAKTIEISGSGSHSTISASSFHFAVDRALGWNQIRSDRYSIRVAQGIVYLDGKGYGHGVGLCQSGAYQMAAEGHDYRQILGFYFPGTATRVSPNDAGWKSTQGAGILLLSVSPAPKLLQEGTEVWTKANATFPVHPSPHPTIHSLPTTELFRQTTAEPGWVLASTRGTDIYLQPPSVLNQKSRPHDLLLHEFLHVLVEQEATPQTPLWLREGLVEALADTDINRNTVIRMSISKIESALANPVDLASSQRAHIAAGQRTEKLINRFGLATVRSWLHSGIPPAVASQLTQPND